MTGQFEPGAGVADVPDDPPPTKPMDAEFAAFFAGHKDEFMRQAVGRLRNLHDADEAVMDAALRMHTKWPVIQAHANSLALARKIVRTCCIDFYRRRARLADREALIYESGCASAPTADDLLELRGYDRVDRALEKLDQRAPRQAECVRLRFLEGLDLDEIAETLRVTKGAVKTNIHHGLKALQALMDLPEPGKGDSR